MLGKRKYFGKVENWSNARNEVWKVTVFAADSQEARVKVARKFQIAKAPHRTLSDILYDVSVRKAVEAW